MTHKIRYSLMITVFLFTTLLFGITTCFANEDLSVDTNKEHSFKASQQQLQEITKLWGKQISKGKFLEKTFPDAVAGMSKDTVEQLYKMEMIWPERNVTATQESSSQGDVGIETVYSVGHESNLSVDSSSSPKVIDFDSGSRVWLPTPYTRIPFMDVTSYLFRGDDLVAAVYDYGENVYTVSAAGKWPVTIAGAYEVIGIHTGTYPSGTVPPGYSSNTHKGPINVTP